ncbi:MAG TPA: hypothetical protein VMV41_13895, partial [Cellulomonadaceae bacterium]|nr:hypothetical protein [Cellulomonadaceae bacterium]
RNVVKDAYPVPKSSIAIWTPLADSAVKRPIAAGELITMVSVNSRWQAMERLPAIPLMEAPRAVESPPVEPSDASH